MSRDQRCQTILRSMLVVILCWGGWRSGEGRPGVTGNIAEAAIPRNIHYQGKLSEPSGSVLTGDHTVTLRLYDAVTGGTQLWQETHSIHLERADNGVFSVVLGSQTPFDASITFNNPLWLSIDVDGQGEFSPRQLLAAVSYALNADQLGGVSGSQFLRGDIDTTASGRLKLTRTGAAFLIKPSTDPSDTITKMIDLQNASGISKFSVDAVGNVTVAGNLAVSGTIGGATSTTGTTNASWTIGSGTEATSSNLSLLFGQTGGQQSITFKGAGTSDFVFSDPIRLATESALRLEGSTAGGPYVAFKAPASMSSSVTWTLPSADGTTGQVLTTNGSGVLSWATDVNSGGTITGVTAGTGLTGGGTSGTVTLDVGAGNGIQVNADDVAIKLASGAGLVADATGLSLLRACANGQLLKWNATTNTWTCAADDNTGSGGTVTSITTGTGLTGGTITTSGTITVDVGTTANKIVQLDASAKLPAVDGSVLTNLSATNISSGTLALARGGTGATTANAARTNLGAAASGANTDITSLSGLTTSLSVAQGGTGAAALIQGGLLIGQGTSAVTTTGVLAKGALIVGDGVTDPTLLAVGGNHAILMADATQASGLKWAAGCMPIGGTDATSRNATFEMSAFGVSDTSSRGDHLWPVPVSGTVTTLRAFVNQAPSGTASWTVRLRKNGANATLNCLIAGTGTSCSASGTDTFAAGDRLGVEFTEGGSASGTLGSGWSACFVPD